MRYYDHYHDPHTHLQLTRQAEDELLRGARRRDLAAKDGVIRELRAVRQRLEVLEAKVQRLRY